jgi:hypothetical protein
MNNSLKAIEIRMLAKLRVNDSLETKGYTFDFNLMRKLYYRKHDTKRIN